MSCLPNFLIIGAAKAGTTSLYEYLKQHPEIYMSPTKEPHYFVFGQASKLTASPIKSLSAYKELFAGVTSEKAVGEASTSYLYYPEAAKNIQVALPDVKIIAILRNPVDRAYSQFLFNRQIGLEKIRKFSQALEAEEKIRLPQGWGFPFLYKNSGFYYRQLKRYFEFFSQERVRVYFFEEFRDDPLAVLRNIFCFLGVDQNFKPNMNQKYNPTVVSRNEILDQIVSPTEPNWLRSKIKLLIPEGKTRALLQQWRDRLQALNQGKPQPLVSKTRSKLLKEYEQDLVDLEGLIGREVRQLWK